MSGPPDLRIWCLYLTGIDLKEGERLKEKAAKICFFNLEPALFNHHHEQLLWLPITKEYCNLQ